MKAAFSEYLAAKPHIQAIFVGTRRTDPHGKNLTHFDPTDGGWPPFVRVHPVVDWHYQDIWTVSSTAPASVRVEQGFPADAACDVTSSYDTSRSLIARCTTLDIPV